MKSTQDTYISNQLDKLSHYDNSIEKPFAMKIDVMTDYETGKREETKWVGLTAEQYEAIRTIFK